MEAGQLYYPIELYKQEIIKTDFGSTSKQWVKVLSTRAKVYVSGAARATEDYAIVHDYTTTFTIRDYHKVMEEMQIKWQGNLYRIDYIIRDDKRHVLNIKAQLIR